MARPLKDGVDYFPLDVSSDRKFQLIEAKFGIIGFGIIIRLYQAIYADNGYYINWDDDIALITAAQNSAGKCQISLDDINAIVTEAVNRDIFDKNMYEKYGILTSHGIQKRYMEAVKRRSVVEMKKQYLLLDVSELPINVNINGINVNINDENVYSNPQSKVNKSKVNKNIVNNSKESAAPIDDNFAVAVKTYEDNIGVITTVIGEKIMNWLESVDVSLIEYAIEQAVVNNKRRWNYAEAIIKSHFNAGRLTRQAAEQARKPRADSESEGLYDHEALEKRAWERLEAEE